MNGLPDNVPSRGYLNPTKHGNDAQRRTDADLHDKPGPDRIRRILYSALLGMTDNDQNAFPSTGDNPTFKGGMNFIQIPGHTRITKIIYPAPGNVGSHLADETVQIDSPSAATPLY